MQYLHYVEESKTWVCPKSGVWKIICIGGGGAGAAGKAIGGSGGTTSFGSILSANGGAVGNPKENSRVGEISINGYNGAVGYGTQNTIHYTGYGYGASGGSYIKSSSVSGQTYTGRPGELKSVIVDIMEGASIPCTIGLGGEGASLIDGSTTYKSYAGANGAIIVQYLGESM